MNLEFIKPGKLAYRFYFEPIGRIQKALRQGLLNTYSTEQARKEMQKKAFTLRQVPFVEYSKPLEVAFLTGKKYWYQTAFCAYSLSKVSSYPIKFIFYDDGTFDKVLSEQIKLQFPLSIIISIEEIEENLASKIPLNKFPKLHHKRKVYPHIKKLIDVHTNSYGWKLLLDSDMIFFKSPDMMIQWLKKPQQPLHMIDVYNAYGYSIDLMQQLAKAPIPQRVNVGMIGLNGELIDWEKIEYWINELEKKEGASYYLEQALTAMIIADKNCIAAPADTYIVLPSKTEVEQPSAILHHYVAEAKEWYFKRAWKNILP